MENIFLLLLLILFSVIGALMDWLRRRSKPENGAAPRNKEPPAPQRRPHEASKAKPETRRRSAGVQQEQPVDSRRPAARRLALQSRADLHRAIVSMTILGPCRANQPYE